jgi:hypothetical protein
LVGNEKIKRIIEDLLATSKVYMIISYRIITSGSYSRTSMASKEVGASVTFPVSAISVVQGFDPRFELGNKSRIEESETVEVKEPHVYAIQFQRVGRRTKFLLQTEHLALKDMILHDISDATLRDEEERYEEEEYEEAELEPDLDLMEEFEEEDDSWGWEEADDGGHVVIIDRR